MTEALDATPPAGNPLGRPSDYSEETAALICAEIAEGRKVSEICQEDGFPHLRTVYRWLAKHEDFRHQYARAMEDRTSVMAEEILEIADDNGLDVTLGEDGKYHVNGEAVQRSRLRVDTRKWLMSKMCPKKYGERLAVGGTDDPIKVEADPTDAAKVIVAMLAKLSGPE